MIFKNATKKSHGLLFCKSDRRIYFNVITGFGGNALKVCCGGGGPYNYNDTAVCGNSGVIACDDPSQYVSWDGYHLTEAAYRWITKGLLDGSYTTPKFNLLCPTSETSEDFNNYAMKWQ